MPETLEQTIVERRTFARSAPQSAVPAVPQPYAGTGGTLIRALLVVAGLFFALHYVHLRADFPNHSQWMDWAKYTDEGWYGDAAIRHYLLGHWNVPGDFNPAAALPVWPVLELILFRVTGVSLAAARFLSVTVFGLTLLVCYRLMQLWRPAGVRSGSQRLAPALTVLLLAVSPFCFVFSRLAILEPLLVLCTALAALAATHAGRATLLGEPGRVRTLRWSIALGVLLPLAVLTKTTAIFLFPAIGWTLLAACGFRMRPLLRSSAIAGGVAALLWLGYYGLYVRPHALVDYRYLFSANTYTGFGWNTLPTLLHDTIQDTVWMGRPLLWLGLPAIAWCVVRMLGRGGRRDPLAVTMLLWVFGYGAFLTYHANLQPRYYLVIALPFTALVAMAFEWGIEQARRWKGALRPAAIALGIAAIGYTAVRSAAHTAYFVTHPEYTWLSAANQVRDIVNREAKTGHPRLLLSISGSDISLMTGVPSICDDFGSSTLVARVAKYRPGWFAAWNDVEDDKLEALNPLYTLHRVAAIPAFDDPERNLLILYRLDPRANPGAYPAARRRKRSFFVPRSLRTPQPSGRVPDPADPAPQPSAMEP